AAVVPVFRNNRGIFGIGIQAGLVGVFACSLRRRSIEGLERRRIRLLGRLRRFGIIGRILRLAVFGGSFRTAVLLAAAATLASVGRSFCAALLVVLVAVCLGLGLQQRLPVGDGDLVVIGVDFTECEKAVAIAAILDESSLERRLNTRYACKVDISSELLLVLGFEIKFFNTATTDDDNTGLLRMGGVY